MTEDVHGLTVGTERRFQRTVTDATVTGFIEVSGDTNPLHSDAAYAARTRFQRPIAHGMIGASFISAAIATTLQPSAVMVYLSQDLQFRAPVYVGDVLTVVLTVKVADAKRNRVTVDTNVVNQDGTEVIRGEASILVDALTEA